MLGEFSTRHNRDLFYPSVLSYASSAYIGYMGIVAAWLVVEVSVVLSVIVVLPFKSVK